MTTRSGRRFLKAAEPQPAVQASSLAQYDAATRVSKRARSDLEAPPLQPEADAEPSPARKRTSRGKASTTQSAHTGQPHFIDLTQDADSDNGENAHVSHRSLHYPQDESGAKIRRGRGGRRNGKLAQQNRPTVLEDALGEDEMEQHQKWARAQDKRNEASRQLLRTTTQTESKAMQSEQRDMTGVIVTTKTEKPGSREQAKEVTTGGQVMFTLAEAKIVLERAERGANTHLVPPYNLQTGDYLPYPVTRSYHLGSMGRYGCTTAPHASRSTDEYLSAYQKNTNTMGETMGRLHLNERWEDGQDRRSSRRDRPRRRSRRHEANEQPRNPKCVVSSIITH